MIERDFSDEDGIIVVTATGVWNQAEVDEHYEALRTALAARRRAGLPVRILSDVREAQRQSTEIETRILWQIEQTFQPGDRVAILVSNLDDKNHVRSLLGAAEMATFSSQLPAEMWLLYDGLEAPR